MSSIFDTGAVVRLITQLVTPFERTDAYRYGIIDRVGNKLRSPKTVRERRAYNKFHVVVFNLKKLIEKVPGGKSKIASYGAAAWLLKECEQLDESNVEQLFEEALQQFDEEAAANAAGGGQVAAIGVGPDGEPGVDKKKKRKYKEANQLDNTNLLTRGKPA